MPGRLKALSALIVAATLSVVSLLLAAPAHGAAAYVSGGYTFSISGNPGKNNGHKSDTFTVTGSGFAHPETVHFRFKLPGNPDVGTVTTSTGAFTKTLTVHGQACSAGCSLYAVDGVLTGGNYQYSVLTVFTSTGFTVPLHTTHSSSSDLSATDYGLIGAGVLVVVLVSGGALMIRRGKPSA